MTPPKYYESLIFSIKSTAAWGNVSTVGLSYALGKGHPDSRGGLF